jgi:hypothetical protein
MPAVSFEMMNHFSHMDKALKKYNLSGELNFSDYTLLIKNSEKKFILHPQHQNKDGYYYPNVSQDTARFIGWRPYSMKTWKKAADKVAFKRFLKKNSIATPTFYTNRNDNIEINDVIIKLEESSFGKGIKGPFKSTKDVKLNIKGREFFEQYIDGEIVKIWFWEHKPIAVEALPHLCIYGNGHSTIHELIVAHAQSINRKVNTGYFEEFIAYNGETLQSVLENGKKFPIDFRYKSLLPTSHQTKDMYVRDHPVLSKSKELINIGKAVEKDVPYSLKKCFAYVVDAVIDSNQKVWILELNCNPHIHPYIYDAMITSLVKNKSLAFIEEKNIRPQPLY